MRKIVKIHTNFFDLAIHWNTGFVSMEGAILIGILMLRIFSTKPEVAKLCTVLLLVDVIGVMFALLIGCHISIEEPDAKQEPEKMDTEVTRRVSATPKQNKTETTSKQTTIKNKVPLPNGQPQPQPQPAQPQQAQTQPQEDKKVKSVTEMTEADWDELFKME